MKATDGIPRRLPLKGAGGSIDLIEMDIIFEGSYIFYSLLL